MLVRANIVYAIRQAEVKALCHVSSHPPTAPVLGVEPNRYLGFLSQICTWEIQVEGISDVKVFRSLYGKGKCWFKDLRSLGLLSFYLKAGSPLTCTGPHVK